jgi:endonuclease/exonuclease/phosphatase family metal-dependent hydrolase
MNNDMNQTLRLASWNIGGGFIIDYTGRPIKEDLQYFIRALLSLSPDVICLQEVHVSSESESLKCPFIEILKQPLGLEYACIIPCDLKQHSHIDTQSFLALGIISRHPQVKTSHLVLPNPNLEAVMSDQSVWRSHDKTLLGTTLQIGSSQIKIVTGHTVPFHRFGADFLEPRFEPIRTAIENYILDEPENSIFAGDLNYEDIDKLLPRLLRAGFIQALPPGPTEPYSQRRHDHILVSKNLHILSSSIITGCGDHSLCLTEIKIRGRS